MHKIEIKPAGKRIRVLWQGKTIMDSTQALDLAEASYPVVRYFPRADADMNFYAKTAHRSHCPYKGDASYFSLVADGQRAENAVWTYETPLAQSAGIEGHLAFYPHIVEFVEES